MELRIDECKIRQREFHAAREGMPTDSRSQQAWNQVQRSSANPGCPQKQAIVAEDGTTVAELLQPWRGGDPVFVDVLPPRGLEVLNLLSAALFATQLPLG